MRDFTQDTDPDDAGNGALQPSLDALIGGTLALMTAWTDAAPRVQAVQAAQAVPAVHRQPLLGLGRSAGFCGAGERELGADADATGLSGSSHRRARVGLRASARCGQQQG